MHDHRGPRCGSPRDGRIQVGRPCPPDGVGERGDPMATCKGGGDRPSRGPVCRIQSGRPTAR